MSQGGIERCANNYNSKLANYIFVTLGYARRIPRTGIIGNSCRKKGKFVVVVVVVVIFQLPAPV